ncbi:hypothetical protein QEZ47_26835 [Aminobacter anthyllidis]|uniref:hypothetical protein n=1 Tax=Aminobacter anthyllidis TaxID=1035067 RepID=UPI00245903B2|nr:hypothetical protein [Aminobacter anthyllidis]MDH4989062.1 hypothetical protein [Aminobacter anthyllidis]
MVAQRAAQLNRLSHASLIFRHAIKSAVKSKFATLAGAPLSVAAAIGLSSWRIFF